MPRALSVVSAAQRGEGKVLDTLILPYAQRQAAQKGFLFASGGACIELDLPEPVRLRTDDALVLDDGTVVEVVAEPEPLLELRANDLPSLARLAWHLGNRHVPVQVLERRLRLRSEPEIGAWLAQLGVKGVEIEAPFEPEGGAYEAAPHDHAPHDHAHHHVHDHGHHHHHSHDHHHDHGDACGCGHDHAHAHPAHEDAHSHDHGKR